MDAKVTAANWTAGWRPWLLIVAAAVLPYVNSFRNDFVWDDRPLIVEDHHIRSARYLDDIFFRDFFSHSDDELKYGYYRPVITLSYMLDLALYGLKPAGFHATNIAFHAGCAALVYLIALRLYPSHRGVALAAAVLFGAHAIHTESVTWIAGRTDVISGFFLLAAFYAHMLSSPCAPEAPPPRGRRLRLRALALLLFALSALAKEMAFVLPVLVFLYEYFLGGRDAKGALRGSLSYVLAVLVYVVWRRQVAGVAFNPSDQLLRGIYLLSLMKTFWRYVLKLVWPVGLSAYIQNPHVERLWDAAGLAALALSVLLFAVLARLQRARSRHLFVIGAFIASFTPLSNVINISAPVDMGFPMSERFLYVPSVFFCVLAAWLIVRAIPSPRAAAAVVGALAVFWTSVALARNRDWRDEGAFFARCLDQAPYAPLLHANLGLYQSRQGLYDEAAASLRSAIRLNEEQVAMQSHALLNNLAVIHRMAGQYDDAARILEQLRASNPRKSVCAFNLGKTYLRMGRLADAERELARSLQARPDFADALVAMGEVKEQEGRFDAAVAYYRKALALFPRSAELCLALGVACKQAGLLQDAIAAYGHALRLNPDMAAARGNLGVVYAQLNDLPAARRQLEDAIAADPRLWDAQNALGMVYALQGETNRARAKFVEILAADPGNTDALLNEGILFYQAGDTANARRRFEAVLALDPDNPRARSFLRQLGR